MQGLSSRTGPVAGSYVLRRQKKTVRILKRIHTAVEISVEKNLRQTVGPDVLP